MPFEAAWLSGWSERLVGVVLIGIGLWGLRRALSRRLHAHVHEHEGHAHVHVHLHPGAEAHDPAAAGHHHHSHAALAVGTLHGLAGGSHFLGVLPALALDAGRAMVYLASYAIGTVTAMVVFAALLGFLAARAGRSGVQWARGLMTASSAAAIVVGCYWIATSSGSWREGVEKPVVHRARVP